MTFLRRMSLVRANCGDSFALGRIVAFRLSVLALSLFAVMYSYETSATTLPAGFSESIVPGPADGSWNEAVGITFDETGRMFVWDRTGRVWFNDPHATAFSSLIDIREEVGDWEDFGLLGFALDPQFRTKGYIYLLDTVDRHHLLHFGTPDYDPAANEYFAATIGRLTRYQCRASDAFRSINPGTRQVLI